MIQFMEVTLMICLLCHLLLVATQDTELVFSFMVHRHGDRTPSQHSLIYSTDREALVKLIEPYGYDQLTEKGMRRAYRLGQYIRMKYDSLMARKYNESEVFLQSTDTSRTKMTMLVALAAIYLPVAKWKEDLNWTPVPYTTVPDKIDPNRPLHACHALKHKVKQMYLQKYREMEQYDDILDLVSQEIAVRFDVKDKPLYISDIYHTFECQISLGLNLPPKLQEALPTIKAAADTALSILFQNKNNLLMQYTCGLLLSEFYNSSNLVIQGSETEKMRIYSAHHENVYAFSKISRTDIAGMPFFASVFSLNLLRENSTNSFIVEPIFAYDVPGGAFAFKRLQVQGCGNPCYYHKFLQLTQDQTWNYEMWKSNCGREDLY